MASLEERQSPILATDNEKTDAPGDGEEHGKELAVAPKMSASRQTISITALLLSMFLTSLDLKTIVSTAIPRITHDFHSLNDVGWYGSAFFLTMAVFQSVWGKIYKLFHLKYSYLAAILVFELGTLGCAVSKNSAGFIVGRAIAGAGGAGLIGGTYIILAHVVAPEKVPIFYGLTGIIFAVASVVGPLIGGAFTSDVTWRWCFYINLPIGGFAVLVLLLALELPPSARPPRASWKEILLQLDIPGSLLINGSLICLLLALQRGGITQPWGSSQPIGLLVGWIVLAIAFGLNEWPQGERALVSARYLRSHGILTCCAFAFFLNAANYLRLYYLPIYFQAIHNSSPEGSGILLLAFIVPTSIFTMIAGGLLGKVGYYQPFLLVGAAIVTIGSGLIYTLDLDTSTGKAVGYQILAGIGDGIAVQIPVTAVQAFVEQKDIPTVTATVLFFQLGSGVIGVAAGESIFANRMIHALPEYAPGINGSQVLGVGASQLQQAFGEGSAALRGVRQAYLVGIKDAWILTIAFCGTAFVVGLLAPRTSILGKTGVGNRENANATRLKDEESVVSDGGDGIGTEKNGGGRAPENSSEGHVQAEPVVTNGDGGERGESAQTTA